jgi:KUP system potassium uptake protein
MQLTAVAPVSTSVSADPSGVPRGRYLLTLSLATLGVVFGDIGTSPLYALRECLHGPHAVGANPANVLGVLSLIVWALIVVVTIKYLAYVLRADNKGEGGILALMALASTGTATSPTRHRIVVLLGLFGAALLYGDGMITPAISVLSAVEGLKVAAPSLEPLVIPLTVAILVGLFAMQSRGTARVGRLFGPVTLLWFFALAALGIAQIVRHPEVLWALSPTAGAGFLLEHRLAGFLVLGAVFLVVTGGEALYADMGHFGARPIRLTWFAIVLPALVLNYFGQGALLLAEPAAAENPFFRMVPSWGLYPMLLLSTAATVIASQALITGAFSLTRQAMMLGYWPRLRIEHTSAREIGQIYVPSINWLLMLSTIGLVLGFGSSSRLAAAYGIAVTLTMVITTMLAYVVSRRCWGWGASLAMAVTVLFLGPDLAFLAANLIKIHDGGWFPLVMGAAFFTVLITWKRGRALVAARFREQLVPLRDLFELMRIELPARVPGMAVYMSSNLDVTPPALLYNFQHNRVVHQNVVLLTVITEEVARVAASERLELEILENGFARLVARYGFMEAPNVPALMAESGVPGYLPEHTTYFLGRESVLATSRPGMALWRERLFAVLSRNAQPATAFFGIPPDRVIEIGSQVEI